MTKLKIVSSNKKYFGKKNGIEKEVLAKDFEDASEKLNLPPDSIYELVEEGAIDIWDLNND